MHATFIFLMIILSGFDTIQGLAFNTHRLCLRLRVLSLLLLLLLGIKIGYVFNASLSSLLATGPAP